MHILDAIQYNKWSNMEGSCHFRQEVNIAMELIKSTTFSVCLKFTDFQEVNNVLHKLIHMDLPAIYSRGPGATARNCVFKEVLREVMFQWWHMLEFDLWEQQCIVVNFWVQTLVFKLLWQLNMVAHSSAVRFRGKGFWPWIHSWFPTGQIHSVTQ